MSELFPDYRPSWETDQHRELRKHAAEFFRKEATPNQERWAAHTRSIGSSGTKPGMPVCWAWTCPRNTAARAATSR